MTPKISVIVPIYNVGKYIERCARSLFEQTLDDIEFIFVNDCTPDNSIEILLQIIKEYPTRSNLIKIINHSINKGVSTARNTGIKNATGQYIAHCDSDDWVESNMYETLYSTAIKGNCDYVWCDFYINDQIGQTKCISAQYDTCHLKQMAIYISYGWNVIWNILAKKELYSLNDIYCYEGYDFCEDYGLSVRLLAKASKYKKVDYPLYHYNRMNTNSMVNNYQYKLKENTSSQIYIYDKVNQYLKKENLYDELIEVLSWRILCAKRGWLYDYHTWKQYQEFYPDSNKYIDTNPLCSKRDKICQKIVLNPITRPLLLLVHLIDIIRNICKH